MQSASVKRLVQCGIHLAEGRYHRPEKQRKKLEAAVLSSQYLRAQAQLYFDIGQLLTDPRAAERAMATAAKYLAQAEEMEQAERFSSQRAG